IVKLNKTDDNSADIYVKLEYYNPASSVKDRIALAMVNEAEQKGVIQPGDTIVEPTSGNTGIGLALVAAAKGYKLVVVMPDTMSQERRNLLRAYGAELYLTPGSGGMKKAIEKAGELVEEYGYFMPQQFENEANPKIHAETTGKEIVNQMNEGLDDYTAGIGTRGTISGAGTVLKEHLRDAQVVPREPKDAAGLSRKEPRPHRIQGLSAGCAPKVLETDVHD